MLWWFVVAVAVVVMVRVADQENKSPVLWGAVTFGLCLGTVSLTGLPFLGILLGLVVSFLAMTAVNILAKPGR